MFLKKKNTQNQQQQQPTSIQLPESQGKHKKFAKTTVKSNNASSASAINVLTKNTKSSFLDESEQVEMLEPGTTELNAMFVSANTTQKNFDDIKKIVFANRNISRADDLSFLQFLTRVELNSNCLKSIKFLQDNDDVNYLNVANNQIDSLIPLRKLKLQVLNASHNKLESLSSEVFANSINTLKALILNNNELASFPDIKFTELNTLVLSDNELKHIDFVPKCESLKKLSASNNQIRSLPDNIKRCVGLEELRLAHNKLLSLPNGISSVPNLKILNLGHNLISSFDEINKLSLCKKLKDLSLKGNPITKDPEYKEKILKMLPSLEILDDQPLNESKKKRRRRDTEYNREEFTTTKSTKDTDAKKRIFEPADDEQPKKKQKTSVTESLPKPTRKVFEKKKKETTEEKQPDEPEREEKLVSADQFEIKKLVDDVKERKARELLEQERQRMQYEGLQTVNVQQAEQEKKDTKSQSGYAEFDQRFSGVKKQVDNNKKQSRSGRNQVDVLQFLLSNNDDESNGAESW
jgi:Leucine-rich repeat (LRR) protein